ncbi:MAG: hypothetical protein JXA53_08220 [Bacteroidales bacterium]|nr:hypothetical protein [Bacteroidales bacterium]
MIFLNTNNTGNISEDNRYSTGNWIITKKASDSLEIDFITSGWKCRIVLDNKFTATIYSNPTVNHFKWREL